MTKTVAFQINGEGDFFTGELVADPKGGWASVKFMHGDEEQIRKIRTKWIALDAEDNTPEEVLDAILTDEDEDPTEEDGDVQRGDVFPPGIRETYTKGKKTSGKAFIDNDDGLAQQLRDCTLEQVAEVAAKVLGELSAAGWLAYYTTDRQAEGKNPLNPGMVRMNLGNRIRAKMKREMEEANEFGFPNLPQIPGVNVPDLDETAEEAEEMEDEELEEGAE